MTHRIPFVLAAVAMLAACGVESEEEAPLLDPGTEREQLIRLSVDLRGVHPSEAELRLYEGNPLIWERYVDEYIADPRFLDRMMEIFNEQYLVKNGMTYFDLDEAGLEGVDERVMADIIADEPLQLLRKVIAEDLPYSTMVTADYTMANPLLAQFWDIDYPAGATGWVDAQYNDARPHSGMLSMTTFWQKYPSMGGNANRHRANAVSKVFLCDDYLSRPIVLNRAAVDLLVQDPENAIATNQGCQSCHSTLDPLAANFFGFFTYEDDGGIETTEYKPELEEEWRAYSGKEPGYFGRPTSGIVEFGIELAADPRFSDCAVQTVFQGLTQRTVDEDDWTELSAHRLAFEADEMNIKTLVKSIVMSDEYLARSTTDPELAESLQGVRTASPAQIAGIVEDVTGYNWWFDGRDGLRNNDLGLPVLAGGIDSDFVTTRSYVPSVGTAFTIERFAQAAGYYVAEHDLDPERADGAQLLHYVTYADTPENNPEAFDAQVRHLYLAITGIPLEEDASEPADLMQVYKELYSVNASPTESWAGIISAVLRDPRVIFY